MLFFPSVVTEWTILTFDFRNENSFTTFNKRILEFVRLPTNSVLKYHNIKGINIVTRHRLGINHLKGHKFKF